MLLPRWKDGWGSKTNKRYLGDNKCSHQTLQICQPSEDVIIKRVEYNSRG